jgi:hypothetical protein
MSGDLRGVGVVEYDNGALDFSLKAGFIGRLSF